MRGGDVRTGQLFSYVDLEDRVRRDHPLARKAALSSQIGLPSPNGAIYAVASEQGAENLAIDRRRGSSC